MSDIELHNRKAGFVASFSEHPASVGETYLQHFAFAMRFSAKLIGAGLAACIHALVPAMFETTASQMIRDMVEEMDARHKHD